MSDVVMRTDMSVLNSKRSYLKAEDRRSQILEVAKTVFARVGYHTANIADICKAASIGRGTLYQYFQNKRDVLLAVVDQICARLQTTLAERPEIPSIQASEVPLSLVKEFSHARLKGVLDALFADEEALRLVLREARGLDGGIDEVISRIDALLLGAIESDIRASQAAGFLRDVDPKPTALFILGGVEKVFLSYITTHQRAEIEQILEKIHEAELFGLLTEGVRR
jgi:AcrR family transcriptional regulator